MLRSAAAIRACFEASSCADPQPASGASTSVARTPASPSRPLVPARRDPMTEAYVTDSNM